MSSKFNQQLWTSFIDKVTQYLDINDDIKNEYWIKYKNLNGHVIPIYHSLYKLLEIFYNEYYCKKYPKNYSIEQYLNDYFNYYDTDLKTSDINLYKNELLQDVALISAIEISLKFLSYQIQQYMTYIGNNKNITNFVNYSHCIKLIIGNCYTHRPWDPEITIYPLLTYDYSLIDNTYLSNQRLFLNNEMIFNYNDLNIEQLNYLVSRKSIDTTLEYYISTYLKPLLQNYITYPNEKKVYIS